LYVEDKYIILEIVSCVLLRVRQDGVSNRKSFYLLLTKITLALRKVLVAAVYAIYTVRKFVDRYVTAGCTLNLCVIDLSKAFYKVNHHALFIKLIKRHIQFLEVLEIFSLLLQLRQRNSNVWSSVIEVSLDVRQGSVRSSFLFALHMI